MSKFSHLIDDVADQRNHSLSDVLLKAKVLAHRLRSRKFREWINAEIDGYDNQCAFPACTRVMLNRAGEFIGQTCQIEAAEEGGERFNSAMSDDERAAFPNLMLTCYEHHVVTNNVDAFPVLRLAAPADRSRSGRRR